MGARLAISDHDASLTAPGSQKADVVPGSKKKMSHVEANGKLFNLWCADCTFEDEASEELVENAERRAGSYELEYGLKRPLSRLRPEGPRASAFFLNFPSRCASPVWT